VRANQSSRGLSESFESLGVGGWGGLYNWLEVWRGKLKFPPTQNYNREYVQQKLQFVELLHLANQVGCQKATMGTTKYSYF
jgi:hypothetical protein